MQTRHMRKAPVLSLARWGLLVSCKDLGTKVLSLLASGLLTVSSIGAQAQTIDGRFWSDGFVLQSRSLVTGEITSPPFALEAIELRGTITELGAPSYEETRYYSSPRFPFGLDLATPESWTNVEIENDLGKTAGAFHFRPGYELYGQSAVHSAATTVVVQLTMMPQSALTASMLVNVSLDANLPAGSTFNRGAQFIIYLESGGHPEWDELSVGIDSNETIEQNKMLSVSWLNATDQPITLALSSWQSIYAYGRLPSVPPPVPEPPHSLLLLAGLAVLAWVRLGRRGRRAVPVSPPDGRRWRVWRAPGLVLLGGTACFANAQGMDFHATLLPPSAQYAAPADGRIVTVEGEWRGVDTRLYSWGANTPHTQAIDSYDASLYTPHTQYRQFGTSWAKNVLQAPDSALEATTHFELDDAVEGYRGIQQSFRLTMLFHLPDAASTFTLPVTFEVRPQNLDDLNYSTSVSLHLLYFRGSSEAGQSDEYFSFSGAGPAHFDRELTLSSPHGGDIDVEVYADFTHIYNPVPEPGEFAMLSSGLLALAAVRHVRRRYRNER